MARRQHAGVARSTAVGGLAIVLALWLASAPSLWRYDGVMPGFDARVNDLVVAVVLGLLGVTWLLGFLAAQLPRAVGFAAGSWLIVAPLVLDYGVVTDATKASVNDILVGAAVIGLSLLTRAGHGPQTP